MNEHSWENDNFFMHLHQMQIEADFQIYSEPAWRFSATKKSRFDPFLRLAIHKMRSRKDYFRHLRTDCKVQLLPKREIS